MVKWGPEKLTWVGESFSSSSSSCSSLFSSSFPSSSSLSILKYSFYHFIKSLHTRRREGSRHGQKMDLLSREFSELPLTWDLCHLHLLINLRQSCVWWEMQPNYPHWLSQQIANHGHLSEAILDRSTARRYIAKSRCMRAQRHWPSCPDQKDCSAYTQNHKQSESSGLKWQHLGWSLS